MGSNCLNTYDKIQRSMQQKAFEGLPAIVSFQKVDIRPCNSTQFPNLATDSLQPTSGAILRKVWDKDALYAASNAIGLHLYQVVVLTGRTN